MKKFLAGFVVLTGLMFIGATQEAFAHGGGGYSGGGGFNRGGFSGGYSRSWNGGGYGRSWNGGGCYVRPMPRPIYTPYYGGGGYYPGYYGGSGFGISIVKPGFGFSVNNYGW
ncbi:MAG: hypothetical protein KDA36_01270 [Planctomycetaceae bacterium]|nr:hypothetical protein [Planctomycetaceae bacterium]